jgi:hypothetical protein
MILTKIGANRWIPLIVFCWGICTTMTGLIESFGGLVSARMVLGLCEGGFLPGIVSELDRYPFVCPLIYSCRFCILAPYTNVTSSNCGEHVSSPLSCYYAEHHAVLVSFSHLVWHFLFYSCSKLLNSRSSASLSGAFGGMLRTSTTSTMPHGLFYQVFLLLESLICTEWVGWLAGAGFSYLKECRASA